MFSLFYVPLFASAVLGANPFHSRDFHHQIARSLASNNVSTTNSTNSTVDMVAAAYYTGWHAANFTLDDVSWEKYTHLIYAFGTTGPDTPNNVSLTSDDDDLLTQFVAKAQNNSVKAMLSVGGWTGGRSFSTNVGSSENRTAFVKTIVDLATQFSLDGVDFDWEYPNDAGIGCNALSPNDTSNFLSFLQELRADPTGKNLVVSAATPVLPWKDETGSPSTNVSGFAPVLDFITIMNYDVWGSWSAAVGPNSPLNDTCAPAADQMGSAVSAVAAWTAAGMPAHQIVLGVATYGHSFTVTPTNAIDSSDGDAGTLAAFPAFNNTSWPMGDAWDGPQGTDVCGNTDPNPSGNWDYWGLVQENWIFTNGTAQPGIDYRFDECSQTAYVYNKTSEIMVSFDDPPAFKAKGEFIKSMGLRGFNLWEAGGDLNDTLLDAISTGAGIETDGDDGDDCDDEDPTPVTSESSSPATSVVRSSLPSANNVAATSVATPAAAAAATTPASNSSSGGDDDCNDDTPSSTAAAAATTAASSASTAPADNSSGGDDDCDDETSSSAASVATTAAASASSTPVDSSSGGDGDDCDDETASASPAVTTPAATAITPASVATTPAVAATTSASAAAAASATPTDNSSGDGDDDDDDCDDDDDDETSSVASTVPTSVVMSASSSVAVTSVDASATASSSSVVSVLTSASASAASSSVASVISSDAASAPSSSVVTSAASTLDAASSAVTSVASSSASTLDAASSVVTSIASSSASTLDAVSSVVTSMAASSAATSVDASAASTVDSASAASTSDAAASTVDATSAVTSDIASASPTSDDAPASTPVASSASLTSAAPSISATPADNSSGDDEASSASSASAAATSATTSYAAGW